MAVRAFTLDEYQEDDQTRDLFRSQNVCLWPPVHVGHCAVVWNKYLILFGGFTTISLPTRSFDGSDDSRYHSSRMLWFYNSETCEWKLEDTYGESPPFLSSAACAILNDCLYVFCGYSKANFYNEKVYRLDLLTKIWARVFPMVDPITYPLNEDHPSGRDKLASFVHDGSIYLFGGYGSIPSFRSELHGDYTIDADREVIMDLKAWFNCLIRFNIAEHKFNLVKVLGRVPPPRAACASCKVGNRFFIFGGRLSYERMSDFFFLDMTQVRWKKIEPKSENEPWPVGRSWAVLAPIFDENHLLLQGGLDSSGNTLSDFWVFDVLAGKWTEISFANSRVFWHAGGSINNTVYLFGGFKHATVQSRNEESSNELITVSLNPPSLQSLAAESIAASIVNTQENYESDSAWAVLNDYLIPREISCIQRTAKRLKYLKSRDVRINVSEASSSPRR